MSYTADQIEEIILRLSKLKEEFTVDQINKMEEFSDFKTKNRVFYETVLSGNMETSIFKEMMKMKRRLESGEDQYSVDVRFGKYMGSIYLDPIAKKLNEKKV